MTSLVVDARVALSWFLPETLTRAALPWRHAGRLLAPDFLLIEGANVFWKSVQRGILTEAEAARQMALFQTVPIELAPAQVLLADAYRLAITYGRSLYDCLYLALASQQDCPLVTGDRRLLNAMQQTPLQRHLRWIEEHP